MDKEIYKETAAKRAPKSPLLTDCLKAFLSGGAICFLAQWLFTLYVFLGMEEKTSGTLVTVTLIFLAALFTGIGLFDRIARHAGAGTLVPVTGFANSVVSPAIDTKSEGLVIGVGSKIFTIAGPVILFAILSGAVYGVIYYIVTLFL